MMIMRLVSLACCGSPFHGAGGKQRKIVEQMGYLTSDTVGVQRVLAIITIMIIQ